ncbi:MAG: PaaI family thioesterase [Microbacter sp.]
MYDLIHAALFVHRMMRCYNASVYRPTAKKGCRLIGNGRMECEKKITIKTFTMDKYQQYFTADRFAMGNGIVLEACRPGYAKASVNISPQHLNGAGVVHGGLLFTLADFCFAASVNAYGFVTLSISANISFFAKRSHGTLTAESTEIARSNKLCTCDINVYDEERVLLANFKGTAYITHETITF